MKLIHILAIMAIEAVLLCAGVSVASRNSSGTMSAINGPYTPGSVISSSVINARLSDIETELTDSASRSGKGGFSAPVRGADGTVSAPTFSFTSETGSGAYRIGSGDVGFAISGTKVGEWTANGYRGANGAVATPSLSFFNDTGAGFYRIGSNDIGFAINGVKVAEWLTTGLVITAPNTASLKALSGAAGTATDISVGRTAFEGRLGVAAAGNNYAAGSVAGDIILGTSGGNLWLDTNTGSGTPSLKVVAANGGVVVAGGLTSNAVTITGDLTATRTILTKTTPSYGVTVNIDASLGTLFVVTITNNTAFTIANPTNSATGQKITILLRNTSGGSTGNISVGANYRGSSNLLINTNNQYASYEYIYDGSLWYQVSAPAQFAL